MACLIAGTTALPSLAWITNTWYCWVVSASWIWETCFCGSKLGSKNLASAPYFLAACCTPAHVACANELALAKPKNATFSTFEFWLLPPELEPPPPSSLPQPAAPASTAAAANNAARFLPDVLKLLISSASSVDSVYLLRRLGGQVAVAYVAPHVLGVARARVAEPPSAATHRANHIPSAQRNAACLQQPAFVVPAGVEHDDGRRRVASAEQAPGRRQRALEPEEQLRLLAVDRVLAHDAVAPAPAPGTARIGAEAIVRHPHRVLGFEHLYGQVLERTVDVVDQPVLAVAPAPGAPPADGRLEVEPRTAGPVVHPGDADHHGVAVAGARRLIGQHLGERANDQVDEQPERREVPLAGIGLLGAEQRASAHVHRQWPERPAVRRVVGVDQELVGHAAGGDRLRLAAVDRAPAGVVAAREVDPHLLPADLHGEPNPHGVLAVAVVVEAALGAVDAVGDRGDGRPLEALGLREDLVARRLDRLQAVAGDDGLEAPLPGAHAGDLRAEVADRRGAEAAVAPEQVGHVAPLHPALDDLCGPEPDSLLEDFRRVHRAARVLGADVEPVRAAGGEPDQVAADEDRPERRHIVEVRAGHVRVVHDPDVVGLPAVASVLPLGQPGADLEVAQEDRQAGRLTEHPVLGVEQRHRAVLHLVDDRRVGRTDQRGVHLVGRRREGAADDLGCDRVERPDRHVSPPPPRLT